MPFGLRSSRFADETHRVFARSKGIEFRGCRGPNPVPDPDPLSGQSGERVSIDAGSAMIDRLRAMLVPRESSIDLVGDRRTRATAIDLEATTSVSDLAPSRTI